MVLFLAWFWLLSLILAERQGGDEEEKCLLFDLAEQNLLSDIDADVLNETHVKDSKLTLTVK